MFYCSNTITTIVNVKWAGKNSESDIKSWLATSNDQNCVIKSTNTMGASK